MKRCMRTATVRYDGTRAPSHWLPQHGGWEARTVQQAVRAMVRWRHWPRANCVQPAAILLAHVCHNDAPNILFRLQGQPSFTCLVGTGTHKPLGLQPMRQHNTRYALLFSPARADYRGGAGPAQHTTSHHAVADRFDLGFARATRRRRQRTADCLHLPVHIVHLPNVLLTLMPCG